MAKYNSNNRRNWEDVKLLTLPKTKGPNGLTDKLYQISENRYYISYLDILEQI